MNAKQPARSREVLTALRRRIVSGELPPGARLPNRIELQQQFGVSSVTVQRALSRLLEDGFVEAAPGRGTFVTSQPPHLFQYGLVYREDPAKLRFYQHLQARAAELARSGEFRHRVYVGVDGHSDVEDYQLLLRDVRAHRVAGLIFFGVDPAVFIGTPILDEPGIARVYHGQETSAPGIAIVHADIQAWARGAVEYLHARGRRRIAIVAHAEWMHSVDEYLSPELEASGMNCPPHWIQRPATDLDSISACVQLLFSADARTRPDGLIVIPEMLVDGVIAGLIANQVRVPQELEIVSHCNFPAPGPAVMPIQRLGYDSRQFLDAFLKALKTQAHDPQPPLTLVPPRFEDDLLMEAESGM